MVTVIVPEGIGQVGCIKVNNGVAGTVGTTLIVALVDNEVQPETVLINTIYVPGVNPDFTFES